MPLMPLDFELISGKFVRRLNRFMVLAEVGGEPVYAHMPNSGRLTTALYPGVKLYLRSHRGVRGRKSAYSVFAADHENGITVIIDAQFSNRLAKWAIERGLIGELAGYKIMKENVMLGFSGSRIDFLLESGSEKLYLEVKSVTHVLNGIALFPDAPTVRGRRQLTELYKLIEGGVEAGVLFSVQRPDATIIKPNYTVDPEFSDLLKSLSKNGLKILTLKAVIVPTEGIIIQPGEPPFSF